MADDNCCNEAQISGIESQTYHDTHDRHMLCPIMPLLSMKSFLSLLNV